MESQIHTLSFEKPYWWRWIKISIFCTSRIKRGIDPQCNNELPVPCSYTVCILAYTYSYIVKYTGNKLPEKTGKRNNLHFKYSIQIHRVHVDVGRLCNNSNCIKIGYLNLHSDCGEIWEVYEKDWLFSEAGRGNTPHTAENRRWRKQNEFPQALFQNKLSEVSKSCHNIRNV